MKLYQWNILIIMVAAVIGGLALWLQNWLMFVINMAVILANIVMFSGAKRS